MTKNQVLIHNRSSFNHGCEDYAVVKDGVVTEVNNCTKYWQVGHDADRTFATVGDQVIVRSQDEYGESEDWEFVTS